jgi:hypothetical protein
MEILKKERGDKKKVSTTECPGVSVVHVHVMQVGQV